MEIREPLERCTAARSPTESIALERSRAAPMPLRGDPSCGQNITDIDEKFRLM